MYNLTPKYSQSVARSISPLRNSGKIKMYTHEEVQKIIKQGVEPRLQHLQHELENRQQKITYLNEKLNQNDELLTHMRSKLEHQVHNKQSPPHNILSSINQLINDKVKAYWETITAQLNQIGDEVKKKYDFRKW